MRPTIDDSMVSILARSFAPLTGRAECACRLTVMLLVCPGVVACQTPTAWCLSAIQKTPLTRTTPDMQDSGSAAEKPASSAWKRAAEKPTRRRYTKLLIPYSTDSLAMAAPGFRRRDCRLACHSAAANDNRGDDKL